MKITRKESNYIHEWLLDDPVDTKEDYNTLVNAYIERKFEKTSIKSFVDFIKNENNEKRN